MPLKDTVPTKSVVEEGEDIEVLILPILVQIYDSAETSLSLSDIALAFTKVKSSSRRRQSF